MKMYSRIVNRLLVCTLCLSMSAVLAGCGQSQAQDDETHADNIVETSVTEVSVPSSEDEEVVLPPLSESMTAAEAAGSYLQYMALSREGLISQLEYDGFSPEEAAAAADNCGADWNEQALRQAKSYLDTMSFTYDELVSQLEYDKFTHEQAVYAADNCGLN